MLDWKPIATVPDGDGKKIRVLVYVPGHIPPVFEADAAKNGTCDDPVDWEWRIKGATHWAPMPPPPQE